MTMPDRDKRTVDVVPGCEPEIGRAIWALEEARKRTKAELTDLSSEMLDWTPGAGTNSIGALLYHIAAIELDWLFVEVRQEPFPVDLATLFEEDVADEHGLLTRAGGQTMEAHLARLDAVRERLIETYRAMTLDDFRRPRSLEEYDVTPEWVLFHLRDHETMHRGELGLTRVLTRAAA
jgi:uncharacterized damage-inducible protein DinB